VVPLSTPQPSARIVVDVDVINLMDALGLAKAVIAGFDWGARTADIVAALWPDRCTALVSVSGYLIGSQQANQAPLAPEPAGSATTCRRRRPRSSPRRCST
jgi:pimeloyl-ACP methyl ester carboxylesterase